MADHEIEDENDAEPGAGSGRGGALGTPTSDPDEKPPTSDQENNWVVSGGGLTGSGDDEGPDDAADASN
jgi:hypothetical protein